MQMSSYLELFPNEIWHIINMKYIFASHKQKMKNVLNDINSSSYTYHYYNSSWTDEFETFLEISPSYWSRHWYSKIDKCFEENHTCLSFTKFKYLKIN